MSYAWNRLDGYDVFCVSGEQFKVDLRKRECSCRLWQLTGIPCIHAIPPIYSRKQLPADWVDNCYKIETFGWLYENVLEPMTGPSEWPETNNITILPPKWSSQTCKYCGVQGHNVRTCPKKKAEREASGAGHPKKCTTTNKERIEKEQAEHEAYLINLHNWINEMRNIVPNVPTTQLPSQPNPNVATTELPSQPNPTRKNKMLTQTSIHTKVSCSQPNPTTVELIEG
ncbi:hypothetical protein LIER_27934 [Lithospermum erythrorhizon]|uniref:SWIM-type domain-containing protein n=1 Tax=Lithospermum erythrorhizon TaxID=34254 RepID=A0AAV3RFV2_LITER